MTLHDLTEKIAYGIWEIEGYPEGQADRHWFLAESVAPHLWPLLDRAPPRERQPKREKKEDLLAASNEASKHPPEHHWTRAEFDALLPYRHRPESPKGRDYDAIRRAIPSLVGVSNNNIKSAFKRINKRIEGGTLKVPAKPTPKPRERVVEPRKVEPQAESPATVTAIPAPPVRVAKLAEPDRHAEKHQASAAIKAEFDDRRWPYQCPTCGVNVGRAGYCDAHRYTLRPIEINSRPVRAGDPNAQLAKSEPWTGIRELTPFEKMTGRTERRENDG